MKDEALHLALEALNTAHLAVEDDMLADEIHQAITAIKQALTAQPAPVAWAEYNFKKGKFTGLTTDDINAVDSVGDGCQWVPQLQALAAQPVQGLPFGVGGGLVAIKTLLGRDPCVHANTAIEMIDAILKEHPAAQPAPEQYKALEQALTRLQKRYGELEAKAAAQPAVPDAITDDSESPGYRTGWNDCRVEMLKGMKP